MDDSAQIDTVSQPVAAPMQPIAIQQPGGLLEPVYQNRQMKCVVVTESELRQLGLANILTTVFVSIGSFLFAFGIDLVKDTWLTSEVTPESRVLTNVVQPICFFIGLAFFGAAVWTWFWRRDLVDLIKKESESGERG